MAETRKFLNSVTVLVRFHSSVGHRLPIGVSASWTITLLLATSIDLIFFETKTPSCSPTMVRPAPPRLNGSTVPRLVSSLCSVLTPARTDHCTSRNRSASRFSASSRPLFSTDPMLSSGLLLKPSDGGMGLAMIRSFVVLRKYVSSAERRLSKNPASRPASNSSPRSGLRSALPGLPGMAPAPVVPVMLYEAATSVVSASPGLGERPVVPYAARRRSVFSHRAYRSKNFSSEIAQLAPIFGSTNAGDAVPNDEFLSMRTPSWTNRLFELPICSCVR